jgi:hypothetical protein
VKDDIVSAELMMVFVYVKCSIFVLFLLFGYTASVGDLDDLFWKYEP